MKPFPQAFFTLACALLLAAVARAQVAPAPQSQAQAPPRPALTNAVFELDDGTILAADELGTYAFQSWSEYVQSPFFVRHGKRCEALAPVPTFALADCNASNTTIKAAYEPSGGVVHRIPVVWHVLYHNNGSGNIPDSAIHSQMEILNEDFRAIAGSLGGNGNDTRVEFYLATAAPNGNPTTGITRHKSNSWYNDSGTYYNSVGWDTTRYLNIYTNTAGGNLGYAYVPSGGGVVGQSWDGVRMHWATVGENAPIGDPYDLGRTTTHEVGHYLGLYHTFQGGCASASGCSSNGDLICDTNPESSPNYSPCSRTTCGSADPTNNYLDYSDDICMREFTPNQANRMRCTLDNFRFELVAGGTGPTNAPPSVNITSPASGTSVSDGTSIAFSASASDVEDGNLSSSISWSSNLDGALGGGASINSTLSVGTHVVTASVTDSAGAPGSDTVGVTVTSVGGGGGIVLSTSGYKIKGNQTIDLSWSGASGASVEIWRNGGLIVVTNNDGAYTHATSVKGGGSYSYQVCESGGAPCSNASIVTF